jgi:ferric-dicitrate binding protein FerR (iron transport regulator)
LGANPLSIDLYIETIIVKQKNMSKIRQIIEAYIDKNTYPVSVQKQFAAWMREERNKKEKDEILLEIWDKLDIEPDQSTEKSFQKLQARITNRTRERKFMPLFHKLFRIAAIFLLPILSVTVTYLYMKKDVTAYDIKWVECIIPKGEMRNITLPDSSKVQLNAGSILIYPQHFGKTRDVYISGEAYFSVVQNNKQPFIVKTVDMEVEVLGTVFNISSYSDSESSSATLESGKINVRFKNQQNQPVILAPNEQIIYNRVSGFVEKQTVKVENIIAWTKGDLVIQNMSIKEIAKIIERKYDMKVYTNLNRYKNEKITMKFTNDEEITEFMMILKYLIPNLQYKIENDKLYIY